MLRVHAFHWQCDAGLESEYFHECRGLQHLLRGGVWCLYKQDFRCRFNFNKCNHHRFGPGNKVLFCSHGCGFTWRRKPILERNLIYSSHKFDSKHASNAEPIERSDDQRECGIADGEFERNHFRAAIPSADIDGDGGVEQSGFDSQSGRELQYTSPNTSGALNFAPAANCYGTATITVTVNNNGANNNIVTQSFIVTVNAVNQPPTLNSVNAGSVPTILIPPQTQTAEVGGAVNFAASVTGSPFPTCWWFFNGNAVAGCTNRLGLSGIQASNAGAYTIVVSNVWGAVTSAPAMLNVIATVERRPVPAVSLMAPPGSYVGLDYSDDSAGSTAGWKTMATMTLSNASQFYFDVSEPLPPQRFYRVWQTGTSGTPSANLNFVPAIKLTGSVGDSLRLDYINQTGPTDAWVTLDTVTLTNTSQLYFDVSVLGQPGRLYRIVPVP